MSTTARRLVPAAVAGVALALALTACAGLPTSSDVQQAEDVPSDSDLVTYQPAPPAPGAEPQEVVAGFLDAMLAYPASSGTASDYLSSAAADDWAAGDGVQIYRAPVITVASEGEDVAIVDLTVQQTGTLDRTGHFREAQGVVERSFRLVRDAGEWRIDDPAPGLAITRGYFETYYRAFEVFQFDVGGTELVADPVHLQVGERLATSLTAALVSGAPPRIAGETRTYVPDAESWTPAVTVRGGRATVEFDTSLTTLDVDVRRRLSAQVVRTLGQVPGVRTVRIVGSDGPLVAGGSADQAVTAWARFDPASPTGRPSAVVDGRLATLDDGPASGTASVVEGAPDPAGDRAIAVGANGWAVVGGDGVLLISTEAGQRTEATDDVVALAWGADDALWVADRPGGALRVRLVTDDVVTAVPVVGPNAGAFTGVTSFAIDPTGRRYAVTTSGGELLAGVVTPGSAPSLGAPVAIAPDVVAPADVVWTSSTEVAVVGDGETGRQVYRALVDGSPSNASAGSAPRLPNIAITALAAGQGPDPDLYVTDDRTRLWFLPAGGSWRLLDVSATAVSSGR